MPIYEYTCQECDAKFEQLVRTMDGNQKFKCPSCGSERTSRAFSVFAVGGEAARGSDLARPDVRPLRRPSGIVRRGKLDVTSAFRREVTLGTRR